MVKVTRRAGRRAGPCQGGLHVAVSAPRPARARSGKLGGQPVRGDDRSPPAGPARRRADAPVERATPALSRAGYSRMRASDHVAFATPRRSASSSSGSTKKSCVRCGRRAAPPRPGAAPRIAAQKGERRALQHAVHHGLRLARRACTSVTCTSSPFMASRTPPRATAKVPSAVSTLATPGRAKGKVPVRGARGFLRGPWGAPPPCGPVGAPCSPSSPPPLGGAPARCLQATPPEGVRLGTPPGVVLGGGNGPLVLCYTLR